MRPLWAGTAATGIDRGTVSAGTVTADGTAANGVVTAKPDHTSGNGNMHCLGN